MNIFLNKIKRVVQNFNQSFRNFSLSKKFNFLLFSVFMIGILITGGLFALIQKQAAQEQVTNNALMLMQTMNAVRSYTSEHINPLLSKELYTQEKFISETVPAFSATTVFENFRSNPNYSNFSYKEAVINPTNLKDKANDFEIKIIEQLRQNANKKEVHGYLQDKNNVQAQFYIARPLAITKESCLQCHSTPENAPKSMLVTYGDKNGFGWQLNEIVGIQLISVPAEGIFRSAYHSMFILMTATVIIFALAIYGINLLLNRAVIDRLINLSVIADQVSKGIMSVDFESNSEDEIGILEQAFNRMKKQISKLLTRLSKQDDNHLE